MESLATYALAFTATFVYVFLKAIQQLNVVRAKYIWIVPTSFAMAVCEVYTVVVAAERGWGLIVLPIGLGGGLGCVLAVWVHGRFIKRGKI